MKSKQLHANTGKNALSHSQHRIASPPQQEAGTITHRWPITIAIFIIGVVIGLVTARNKNDASSAAMSVHRESAALTNMAASSQPDSVRVLAGGLLSIHADNVTPVWLQSELARQGVTLNSASEKSTSTSAVLASDEDVIAPDAADIHADKLVSAVRNGTDQERLAALTQSLEEGIDVPTETLKEAVQSDPSPEVRLLAFRMYADAMSADVDDASAALALGTSSVDADVRAEAQSRVAELEQLRLASASQAPSE